HPPSGGLRACGFRGVGQPGEIVESALDIAAELVGRALVADDLPYRRVAVEGLKLYRADFLEERAVLDSLERRRLFRLGHLDKPPSPRIQHRDSLANQLCHSRIALRGGIDVAHDAPVGAVIDPAMGKNPPGHL